MSGILALPVELLERIVSFTDSQKTLASLNRTSKLLQELTETYLYTSVVLKYGAPLYFAAAVSKCTRRKPFVKEVYVNCSLRNDDDEGGSACTYTPLFAEFPNLETLSLYSGYWHWDDTESDDPDRVLWQTDQDRLTALFEKAGLSKPLDERIWTKLRSCTLDFWEMNGQGWYCTFEPAVFLVASLEELTLRGCRFHDDDGKDLLTSPYRGQTTLKKLALEGSYIYHTAVFNFLTTPKALTHLTLAHKEGLWHHEMGYQPSTSKRAQDYMDAFELHKNSLQYLCMNDEMCDEIREPDSMAFDFADFAELKGIQYDRQTWILDDKKRLYRRGAHVDDEDDRQFSNPLPSG